jgi:ATP-dependent Zn protease
MDNDAWSALAYTWAPIILMIGFWLFFMRRMSIGRQGKYMDRSIAFMDRQEQLLERIAVALERRNGRD